MARYVAPVSKTRFPAGEDPTPATAAGVPEKLSGVLGHVARCVAVIDDPFSGQRRPVSGRRRPVSGHHLGPLAELSGAAGAASRGEGVAFICRARGEAGGPGDVPGRGAPLSWIASRAIAGVGVALNCRARAPTSALPAIPRPHGVTCPLPSPGLRFRAEAPLGVHLSRFCPICSVMPTGCRASLRGYLSDGCARHSFAKLAPRSVQPQRALLAWGSSPAAVPHCYARNAGGPGRRARARRAMVEDRVEGCSRRGRGIKLPGLRPLRRPLPAIPDLMV
ncbi:hypothetical protein OIU74_026184 [Salix koriyanagi]|uniref:Uncharacterized protein n=1 Tax=Salix koriyanagi TaxID=2511006 RepID=A0A9Q1A3I5_9ROSI|nr:hypothetical protein OIU74_026184 [Salix koriyanagi]